MKRIKLFAGVLAALLAAGWAITARAADETSPPPGQEQRAAVRSQWRDLTPEQREAKRKELREKRRKAAAEAPALAPEQREAKRKETLAKRQQALEARKDMTPEQRAKVVQERHRKLEKRQADLRQKQAAGTLTDQEKRQLEHLEQRLKFPSADPGKPAAKAPPASAQ